MNSYLADCTDLHKHPANKILRLDHHFPHAQVEGDWGPAEHLSPPDQLHPHLLCPNMRYLGENNFCRFCRRNTTRNKIIFSIVSPFFTPTYTPIHTFCYFSHYQETCKLHFFRLLLKRRMEEERNPHVSMALITQHISFRSHTPAPAPALATQAFT